MSVKVKICGLTNVADAEAAMAAGASYLGLIFVKDSARFIDLDAAVKIARAVDGKAKLVGVFKDHNHSEIEAITSAVPLYAVQLHGRESPEFCQALNLPVVKALTTECRPGDNSSISQPSDQVKRVSEALSKQVEMYQPVARYLLFDRPKDKMHNDWLSLAIPAINQIEAKLPAYFLAGGLSVENLATVLTALKPYALDVASGVEDNPRKKNHGAITAFCALANKQWPVVPTKE